MAYPAKKIKNLPDLRIIEGGKNKKNKTSILIVVFLLVGITGLLVVDNFDISNNNETVKNAIDWDNPPCSPKELSSEWEEITHPKRIENKVPDRTFKNKKTNKIIDFHPYDTQGRENPHWHRYNPFSTKKKLDYYLDKNGKPVGYGRNQSHIYVEC